MLRVDKEIPLKRKYFILLSLFALILLIKIKYEPKGYASPWLNDLFYIAQYILIQLDGWVPLSMGICGVVLRLRKVEVIFFSVIQAVAVVAIILFRIPEPVGIHVLTSIFSGTLLVFLLISLVFLPFLKNKTMRSYT